MVAATSSGNLAASPCTWVLRRCLPSWGLLNPPRPAADGPSAGPHLPAVPAQKRVRALLWIRLWHKGMGGWCGLLCRPLPLSPGQQQGSLAFSFCVLTEVALKKKKVYVIFTQCGAQTDDPKTEGHVFFQRSQPGSLLISFCERFLHIDGLAHSARRPAHVLPGRRRGPSCGKSCLPS